MRVFFKFLHSILAEVVCGWHCCGSGRGDLCVLSTLLMAHHVVYSTILLLLAVSIRSLVIILFSQFLLGRF